MLSESFMMDVLAVEGKTSSALVTSEWRRYNLSDNDEMSS